MKEDRKGTGGFNFENHQKDESKKGKKEEIIIKMK